ncbi:hypothetical protein [Enterococcus pallens]|uniref:Lipoprotein n=1 Tax=Enterococcus pallens ATCC BAA-351 TaxID=1158607 RepID=R2QMD7_9ENTE|nr:hypothetical protein [Enterococcus pallens]EOH96348.1 hypothetical protein UAU_00998 [Enterococcus pallens ATCC BAA-351]EOU14439.1 hypothetical protein I588_04796 [Enterococcus pallens ATCC BAA-351]OJG81074.1 hypothetical protein RV10_GL004073 [Enterococcus pallens]
MKRIFTLLLCFTVLLALSGCTSGKSKRIADSTDSQKSLHTESKTKKSKRSETKASKSKKYSTSDTIESLEVDTQSRNNVSQKNEVPSESDIAPQVESAPPRNQNGSPSAPEPSKQAENYVEQQTPEQPSINESEQKIQNIDTYFATAKQNAIARKRDQVNTWKANGEVEWSDEIISSGLNDFANSLGDSSYYHMLSYEEAVSKIDSDMQLYHDIKMIK